MKTRIAICFAVATLMSACGSSSQNQPGSANDLMAGLQNQQSKFKGPPLDEVSSQPELMDEFACGDNGKKVMICHVPPGNPDARHTLCIGRPAIRHHIAEHDGRGNADDADYLGDCSGSGSDDGGGETGGGDTGGGVDDGGGVVDNPGGSTGGGEAGGGTDSGGGVVDNPGGNTGGGTTGPCDTCSL